MKFRRNAPPAETSQLNTETMKRYLPFIIIIVVLAGAVGLGVLLSKWSGAKSDSTFVAQNQPVPPGGTSAPAGQPPPQSAPLTKPNVKVSSPVVLEEFGDYQCPPCGQLYPELKRIEAEYGDQVRIVFHHLPQIGRASCRERV